MVGAPVRFGLVGSGMMGREHIRNLSLFPNATLAALAQKYAGKVQVLAVELPPDTPKTMLDYANGHKLSYPLLMDMGQVAASYVRVASLNFPHIYLVDGEGMIRGNWEYGSLAKDIFEGNGLSREIDKVLASGKK